MFTLIVTALVYAAGEYLAPGGGVAFIPFAVAFSGFSALTSYFAGDKLVLAQSQARELAAGEEPQLRNIVETLAIGLGIQPPKIYVIEDTAPNAFATGRDPKHASIAVTRGLLQKMDRTELEGVLAHEMSHVINRDIRVLRSMWWGRGGRSRDRGNAAALIAVIALVLAILTPIIATLIQLAVSRQREYLADASGALLTRYPQGLASALQKIAGDPEPLESANKATASLYIANPLHDDPKFFDRLFDTHPPIAERIRRLEAME